MRFRYLVFLPAFILTAFCRAQTPAASPPSQQIASTIPSDVTPERLRYLRVLSMPTVFEHDSPDEEQFKDVLKAITAYQGWDPHSDRPHPLQTFLDETPGSPVGLWFRATIAKDLYLRLQLTEALGAYRQLYSSYRARFQDSPMLAAYVTRVGVDYGMVLARLGRHDELGDLLYQISDRPSYGATSINLADLRDAYSGMSIHPETSFNCGPLAVGNLLKRTGAHEAAESFFQVEGYGDGFTVQELIALGIENNVDLRPLRRVNDQAKLVTPAVVHWRSQHYALIVDTPGKDRVRIIDPTFRINKIVHVQDVLQEASGAFLTMGDSSSPEIPPGYERLTDDQCRMIIGRGNPGTKDKDDDGCGSKKKNCNSSVGMPTYNFDEFHQIVLINDTPLPMETPIGPDMSLSLSYRDDAKSRPTGFLPLASLGSKWEHGFSSFTRVDSDADGTLVRVFLPGGRQETFRPDGAGGYRLNRLSLAKLSSLPSGGFLRISQDQSKLYFERVTQHNSDSYLLTRIENAQGVALTLSYQALPDQEADRLTTVSDALGRSLSFTYGDASYPLNITSVSEMIGGAPQRTVTFTYNSLGDLNQVTDAVGISTSFAYNTQTNDLGMITSMTTPYGTTTFERGTWRQENTSGDFYTRWLKITDPEGLSENLLFIPSVSYDDFPEYDSIKADVRPARYFNGLEIAPEWGYHGRSNYNVSFFWDKKQSKYHLPNFRTGRNFQYSERTRWAQSRKAGILTSNPIPDIITPPATETLGQLQPASTYFYHFISPFPNTSNNYGVTQSAIADEFFIPRIVGRKHEGGEERTLTNYNDNGRVTEIIDPLNIRTGFTYAANGVDIEEVTRGIRGSTAYPVARYVYGSQPHLPTEVYDASNTRTTFSYNAHGQVTSITNPLGERTDFTYGWPAGFTDPTPGSAPTDNDGFPISIKITDTTGTSGISEIEVLSLSYHANTGYLHTATDPRTNF